MSNMLCVDFDFFFPNPMEAGSDDPTSLSLFDWGHSEHMGGIYLSTAVWGTRAQGFVRAKRPLPTVEGPEGGWVAFWERFTFTEDAEVTFADSNAHAGLITPADGSTAFEKIVLFDAHHDSGYNLDSFTTFREQGKFSCEDWMLAHQEYGTRDLEVRYPTWKPNGVEETLAAGVLTRQVIDDGLPVDGIEFDTVFICRSGAWVPPWCDQDFLAFVEACPLEGEQVDSVDLDRGFSAEAAWAMGEQWEQMMSQIPHPASRAQG